MSTLTRLPAGGAGVLFWPGRYGAAPPPCPFYWRDCSCLSQVENRLKIIFVMEIYFVIWLTNMRGIDIFTLFPNIFRPRVRFFSPIIDWSIVGLPFSEKDKKKFRGSRQRRKFLLIPSEFRLFCIYCLQNNWYFESIYTCDTTIKIHLLRYETLLQCWQTRRTEPK